MPPGAGILLSSSPVRQQVVRRWKHIACSSGVVGGMSCRQYTSYSTNSPSAVRRLSSTIHRSR